MEKIEFKVEGMDCGGCVKSVTRMLTGTAGVVSVDVSLEGAKAAVEFDPAKTSLPELKRAVERARFMGEVSELSPEMLDRFTHNHYPHDYALIVTVPENGREKEIAVARYIMLDDVNCGPARCEYAIAVADEWQHHGIGHRLMQSLIKMAKAGGLRYMEGYVLADNANMLDLMRSLGFEIGPSEEGPQVRLVCRPI